MKKSIFSKSLALMLCLILAFSSFAVNVMAVEDGPDIPMDDYEVIMLDTVYVSSSGNDTSNDGSESKPFATLARATECVNEGGTIYIVGSVSTSAGWSTRSLNSAVTIKGKNSGALALTADLTVGFNTVFEDITISGSKNLFANGNKVTFNNVTASGVTAIYGGGNDGGKLNSTNLVFNSGTFSTVYGAGVNNTSINSVNVTVNGGTITAIYGGNQSANLSGNVTIEIVGGTVNNSIFGGCYNNIVDRDSSWLSTDYGAEYDYHVAGTINLIFHANITNNNIKLSSGDKSVFAHSRALKHADETANIIFLSEASYNSLANNSKLAGHDGTGSSKVQKLMGSSVADSADYVHVHGAVTADSENAIISEGCQVKYPTNYTGSSCGSTTITLALDSKASLAYTGKAIEPMVAIVNGNLLLDAPTITYSNNINMGTATATMTYGGVSVSKTFEITKGIRKAPSNLTAIDETIKNKKDGKIEGLTTEMEYSTDGAEFIKVTDPNMNFAPGTYYVRYAESDSYTVSEATTIVINASENKLTVKFVADGKIIKEVSYAYGGTVMSGAIPKTIPEKPGYTVTAPYWDKDVKGMKVYEDITVTAIYTKDILSGDINNDDTVNLYDLVTIAQAQAGWTSINYNREACDTNGDSEFTLDDVTRLAQYLAGYDVTLSKTPFKG